MSQPEADEQTTNPTLHTEEPDGSPSCSGEAPASSFPGAEEQTESSEQAAPPTTCIEEQTAQEEGAPESKNLPVEQSQSD